MVMFPCMPSWRAVWWAIQLWWFCLHGFEYSCEEIGETNPKLCSEQRHIRSFAGLVKALSLRPTFQPTSTPEQAQDFLWRCKGDSWTNVLQFALPCGILNLLLTFSTDAKHFLFARWPGSGNAQNWILFKCMFDSDSLYGLLFVVTRSSCAPSTLFGFCFCSFQRKPGCHYGHSIGPNQQNVWWHLFLVPGNHPTCSSVKWEVLPFFFQKILGCNLQGAATCRLQVYMRKICLKPFTSKYCGTFMNHPGLSYPSSMGLSRDTWHCGRRCL